jgi:MFS family permease
VVLLLTHSAQPWMIIVLSVVVGITDALSMPSFSSIVPSIVERKQIGAGLALNSTQFNISRVAGPAIAGVLMATIGAVGCFALSAASYVPFIGVALWILPPRPRHEGPREALTLRSTFQGLGTVFAAPLLRGALLTAGFSGLLCGPLITFVPVLVRDLLHGGASQYSLSVAAFGVGGVAGALGLLALGPAHDRRRIATVTAMIYAATLLLCAVTPVFWALPVVLVLGGMAMSITNTLTNTLIQSSAAPELRGQAVSLYMIAMRGGIALGSLVTGGLVGLWGVRTTLVANGVLALVAQALVARRWLQGPATVS